jgi:gamma-glutamyltranspeptidase/glutathione hydrolase
MRTLSVLFVLLVVSGFMTMQARCDDSGTAGYDRPYGDAKQSRSVVMAKHGMVATSHPLAAQVGLDVLKSGGNAADAAIAVNAMLGVVEPMNCGLGGDLFAIYWDSKTEKLYGLNASGRSPYGISREVFAERGLKQIPIHGVLSWSVPGCVSGWDALNRRFGTRPLGELLGDAIQTAEEGCPVPQIIAGYWQNAEKGLLKCPYATETFLIDKRAPKCGEVFTNPRLAKSLRAIATGGAKSFYEGDIARKIVKYSEQNNGLMTMKDIADHESEWVDPVSTDYRGYRVWELPPNGQGIAVLQMLNLLEPYDIRTMGPGSADYLHLFLEAKKLAFADRAKFYADPAFGGVPTAELISKEYARLQGKRIDMEKAAVDVPAGDPKLSAGDTIYLTVVDKDRNCCSMIQSTYYHFGSGIVPGDVGFAMQNRGALFTLEEDHLNRLEPHKRPFHTIIPAMVTREGRPWFCFGVMGGDMQPQGHVQVLVNLIDFGMNVQAAGDAARVRHSGSATPRGDKADGGGTVSAESGISEEAVAELRARGHRVKRGASVGGYQGILIDWEQGVLHGGTETRKDGAAVGW